MLMCIAWTSLFHAIFFKRKVKPFYRESDKSKRFKKIDGDYKAWELATCIDKYFPGKTTPVTENLRFLIGLRNKIEHRSMPELDNHVFGECQACLFNFEDILFKEFGTKHCLSECLSLAIQFSRLRHDHQGSAISRLHKPLRSDIREYIDTFRSSLTPEVNADQQYSFKVFLIPKVANSQGQAEVSVEFIKFDPSKPEEMAQYMKLTSLIKPSVSHVLNAGRLKAGDVCKRVEPVVKAAIGKDRRFNPSYHHALACEFYKVRPKKGDMHPEKTNVEMCHYDAVHKDYVYTEKWVTFLIEQMKKPGEYQKLLESRPGAKPKSGKA
ncbi:MAG: DUF3644 domain-containing protein [Planctomycetaceae bacterium]|nr:DUF3644 domain-containing protein [Planctomycetaceae bacterium]